MSTSQRINTEVLPVIKTMHKGDSPIGVEVVAANQGTRDYISNVIRYRLPRSYSSYDHKGARILQLNLKDGHSIDELIDAVHAVTYLRFIDQDEVVQQISEKSLPEMIAKILTLAQDYEVPFYQRAQEAGMAHIFKENVVPDSVTIHYQVYDLERAARVASLVEEVLTRTYLYEAGQLAHQRPHENAQYYTDDSAPGGRIARLTASWLIEAELLRHKALALSAGKTTSRPTVYELRDKVVELLIALDKAVEAIPDQSALVTINAAVVLQNFGYMQNSNYVPHLEKYTQQIKEDYRALETARETQIKALEAANEILESIRHEVSLIQQYADAAREYVLVPAEEGK